MSIPYWDEGRISTIQYKPQKSSTENHPPTPLPSCRCHVFTCTTWRSSTFGAAMFWLVTHRFRWATNSSKAFGGAIFRVKIMDFLDLMITCVFILNRTGGGLFEGIPRANSVKWDLNGTIVPNNDQSLSFNPTMTLDTSPQQRCL